LTLREGVALNATDNSENNSEKAKCNAGSKGWIDVQMNEGETMAKQSEHTDSVYKVVEIIGTSPKSWEDATKNAIETAGRKLRDLRIAEIAKLDATIEDGKVQAYRARVLLSFKYGS
jgi:flavin-binding protein dodecin